MATKATAKARTSAKTTVSLDSVSSKLADAGVNLTDAEKERVARLSKEQGTSTLDAVNQVLDERVGPAAATLQDYPDVYDLMGRDNPDGDEEEERPTGVATSATTEEAEAAGVATREHPHGTETVQSDL